MQCTYLIFIGLHSGFLVIATGLVNSMITVQTDTILPGFKEVIYVSTQVIFDYLHLTLIEGYCTHTLPSGA